MRGNPDLKTKLSSIAAAMLASLALVACGGGGGDASVADISAAPIETAQAKAPPPRAAVEPLGLVGVPDVNLIGLLEGTGGASGWPKITNATANGAEPDQKQHLQRLGKALFWDMQVGGDGIQACASCHYNAGSDSRITNQISPGLKAGDLFADVTPLNTRLIAGHFNGNTNGSVGGNRGFAVSQLALASTNSADGARGQPGTRGKANPNLDVNDVVSSQGVRQGGHVGVSGTRVDLARLSTTDAEGFNVNAFTSAAPGIPNTVRRVEPRNAPTTLNAVYNLRNFQDGRADMFFNGVNPFGFRDPDARVKTFSNGALVPGGERLNIPLSSLASQAVGPIASDFEMAFSARPTQDLGKKLTRPGVIPLRGQTVSSTDSLLGSLMLTGGRGLQGSYASMIRAIFDQRFWGDGAGNDVCLNASGAFAGTAATTPCDTTTGYTLMQWNFALFFGLAVQAYEATLFTEQTIVDLLAGGIATGTVTNGRNVVNVGSIDPVTGRVLNGLALEGCITLAAINTSAVAVAAATDRCTTHYAKFIHADAITGSESGTASFGVPRNTPIGNNDTTQCGVRGTDTIAVGTSARCMAARNTLLNVDRGLGRFFSGATACSVCHFNPEFTGATVSTLTGLGAKLPALPPGHLRKELEPRALMERMIAFNGLPTVYDSGFYNLGVRPTGEDLSIGDQIGGVPLAITKLFDIINGGTAGLNNNVDHLLEVGKIGSIAATIAKPLTDPTGLRLPTTIAVAPPAAGGPAINLAPAPFPWIVGCGPGLVGGGTANNNPASQCITTVIAGERLLRNGAFKAPGLRNAKFTGPYLHNGSKMNLRQVFEFYKTAGHFSTLNLNNLDAGMRLITLSPAEESSLIELLETGLTDWRVAHQQGKFDHPEICIPNGHDTITGKTKLVGIPAVGASGGARIATFQEVLSGATSGLANDLAALCAVTDDTTPIFDSLSDSTIDVPMHVSLPGS